MASSKSKSATAVSDQWQGLSPKQLISNMMWSLKILFQISKKDTLLLLISGIMYRVINPVMSYISAKMIDRMISLPLNEIDSIFNEKIINSILILFAGIAFSHLVRNYMHRLNRYIEGRKFQSYHIRIFQLRVKKITSDLDIQQIEDPEIADTIQQSRENVPNIIFFATNSTKLVSRAISFLVALGISISISWQLTLLISLTVVPFSVIYYKFIKSIWKWHKNTTEDRRVYRNLSADLNKYRFQPEHKISGSNNRIYKIADRKLKKIRGQYLSIFKNRLNWEFADSAIYMIVTLIMQTSLLAMIISGNITIGEFTFYEGNFHRFSNDLSSLIANVIDLIDRGVLVNYLRDLMDLEKAIKSGSQKLKASNGIKIEFKGVSFKYPNTDNYVLKNINLTIHPGEEVAIVGKNGAGKSTLIKLILRFYDPTEGEIFINDIEIKKLNIASYYKHISALFQDFNQYKALTARENILIGTQEIESETKESDSSETSAIPSEINEKLMKSLKQTDAVNFIKNLGKGLDTPLGKNFTGGTELSKGQWQKIALSRILYRNSEMLILDEPTASIDAQAELKIFNNIYEFSENKTVILISHRFSSVRKAEKIFVIEDGKIVESGDHEELMKLEGSYAKSFEIQAEGYK